MKKIKVLDTAFNAIIMGRMIGLVDQLDRLPENYILPDS
jgi:hypothetical protein